MQMDMSDIFNGKWQGYCRSVASVSTCTGQTYAPVPGKGCFRHGCNIIPEKWFYMKIPIFT